VYKKTYFVVLFAVSYLTTGPVEEIISGAPVSYLDKLELALGAYPASVQEQALSVMKDIDKAGLADEKCKALLSKLGHLLVYDTEQPSIQWGLESIRRESSQD